jgi:hypothetical protein
VDLTHYRVAIGRGDGLVARSGDVVMYIADETANAAPLLAALDATVDAELPGRALAKALAVIALGPDSAQIPPFGLIAPTANGLLVMLRGPVTADIESNGGRRSLSGERALTWVDETLSEPIDTITIGQNAAALVIGPSSGLRAGVVPAGGFTMRKVDAPAAAPEPVAGQPMMPAEEQPRPRVSAERQVPAATTRFAEKAPSPPRLPPRPRPLAPPPAGETAKGRPVAGVLTSGDDAVYPLDRPYVIGRNPLVDRAVHDSVASPIVLPDDPQISRVHAYVTVSAGTVLVRDAGTPAGTFIAAPGATTWTRVGAQPMVLQPGWCLRIGQRMLTYLAPGPAQ